VRQGAESPGPRWGRREVRQGPGIISPGAAAAAARGIGPYFRSFASSWGKQTRVLPIVLEKNSPAGPDFLQQSCCTRVILPAGPYTKEALWANFKHASSLGSELRKVTPSFHKNHISITIWAKFFKSSIFKKGMSQICAKHQNPNQRQTRPHQHHAQFSSRQCRHAP
jgi:hypothetical protein